VGLQGGTQLSWSEAAPALTARALAACFALYGLLAAVFLSINMPPFQNPDEVNHFLRIEQISRGELIGRRFGDDMSGGPVDAAISLAAAPFNKLRFHPETKVDRGMYMYAAQGWTGHSEWQSFASSAIYPPTFYLPAVIGVWIGKSVDLSILHTLYLARLSGGLAAVAISVFGIAIAGTAAPWLFAVLALPMTLALMAAASQDGMMIACSALAAGLIARARQCDEPVSRSAFVAISTSLAAIGMARPPYVPFALLPLILPWRSVWLRLAVAAVIVAACLFWAILTWRFAMVKWPTDANTQLQWILGHPIAAMWVLLDSIRVEKNELFHQFIGWRLGWLDAQLPMAYICAAGWMLPIAAIVSAGRVTKENAAHNGLRDGTAAVIVLGAMLLSAGAIFLIQYLTWTPVGASLVQGVQGRYFIPLALLAGSLLPGIPVSARGLAALRWLAIAMAVFPIASLGVMMRAIVVRYYF
jgi:uncharacterized membrane protein